MDASVNLTFKTGQPLKESPVKFGTGLGYTVTVWVIEALQDGTELVETNNLTESIPAGETG